jgi:hypothetical protein
MYIYIYDYHFYPLSLALFPVGKIVVEIADLQYIFGDIFFQLHSISIVNVYACGANSLQ